MTCADFIERCAAYALGALEDDERRACEDHLATGAPHEGCHEALAEAEAAMGALAASLAPVAPSEGLWRAIDARLDAEPARGRVGVSSSGRGSGGSASDAGGVPLVPPGRASGVRRRGSPAWMLAAAALLLLAGASVELGRRASDASSALARAERELAAARAEAAASAGESRERLRCQQALEAMVIDARLRKDAVALLTRPSTRVLALGAAPPVAGAPPAGASSAVASRATAIVNLADRRGLLVTDGLVAPAGHDYELWVIKDGRKMAAGLLRPPPRGELIAAIDPALLSDGVDALAVTLEPSGGGPAPRGPIVLVAPWPRG